MRQLIALSVAGVVLLLCCFPPAGGVILRRDPTNSIQLTSAVQLRFPVVCSTYFRNLTIPLIIDTLLPVSGSSYSYRTVRQLDSVGTWHFSFRFRDSLTGVYYTQWASDACLYDTTAMQGSASGLTAQTIWHYGDGTDTGRTVTGFGGWNNRKLTIAVQTAAAVPISGAELKMYIGTANKGGSKLTLGPGTVVFYIQQSQTYEIRITHNDYSFTTPITFVANANLTDTTLTITGTAFNPGAPAAASMVRTYGYVKDILNAVVIGAVVRVELHGARKIWYKTVAITPYYRRDTTDAAGYWEFDLFPNDSLTPNDSYYYLEIRDSVDVTHTCEFKVPGSLSGSSWQLPADTCR